MILLKNIVSARKLGIFLALTEYLAIVTAAPKTFVSQLDERIVGGKNVSIEDYPYQVALLIEGELQCGGFIISPDFIVTAAHCTDGVSASNMSIRAGSSVYNSGGVVRNVSKIHQNPNFTISTFDYDISVLQLGVPLNYSSGINAASLPDFGQDIPANSTAFVTGWGSMSNRSYPDVLQGVSVLIVSREACRNAYDLFPITDRMICAGYPGGGRDACQGDSGGPLTVNNQVVGVVSGGVGCGSADFPGVYSNVAALRDFIKDKSGI